jgi:hypothetical protein
VDGVYKVSEAIELLQHWDHKKIKDTVL